MAFLCGARQPVPLALFWPLSFVFILSFVSVFANAEVADAVKSDTTQQMISLNAALSGVNTGMETTALDSELVDEEDESESHGLLTAQEWQWLQEHPELSLSGDIFWPPFEFVNDQGEYSGMVSDVIKLIEERLDYQFDINHKASWGETLDSLRERELGVISAVAKTPQREEYMLFTEPYFSFPIVLVIREGLGFVTDLRELDNERVGVVKGYASYDYLIINHPDLNLQVVNTVEEGLQALSDGDLDVFVSNIPSVSYLIKQLGIFNVRLTSITPYVYDLRVGVNPDYPELVPILNKAIASIPQQALDDIYKKWLFKDMEAKVDYRIVRRIAMVSIIVIGIFWYWNRKLTKEVSDRVKSEKALRRSEEQLRQATYEAELNARKADEANRAKSIFLANMSHEIRTPMNAVMGYTELLAAAVTDKKQRSYLDSIRTGSKALLMLINDILDLSKVEAGKLHIELQPVAIKPLFDELQKIFSAKIENKKLKFSVELGHDLPDALMLDETRLRQILFNLVGNAIKFTHNGAIAVKVSSTPLADGDTVNLSIAVEDTGIGIPYDQQERIFRAFEQREGQSNREYGGTGLGLAISKKLVEMMGGQLLLHSEEGKGACFTVKLEQIAIADRPHVLDSASLPELSRYRFEPAKILVADDIPLNRQLVNDLLDGTGIVIKEAENGEQAILIAQQWQPHLILMDIRMPVMDGYEATTNMKQSPETEHIPIVALTASVMSKDEYRIDEAGFDGYLKKPVSGSELYSEIARFLPHQLVEAQADDHGQEHSKLERENLPLSFDSGVRRQVREQFMGQWERLNGSGDIAAVTRFADALYESACDVQLKSLEEYAVALKEAAEEFNLDEMQQLLEGFATRVAD